MLWRKGEGVRAMENRPRWITRLHRGAYDAKRASALSGVPLRTLYDWSRRVPIEPSVSRVRQRLWSYQDLITLRVIHWLRGPKTVGDEPVLATAMPRVRQLLQELTEQGEDLWSFEREGLRIHLLLDRKGEVYLERRRIERLGGSQMLFGPDQLDLLGPFQIEGAKGPDLIAPRERLRIVPGKCAGEPHLLGSRLETRAIAALAFRGLSHGQIAELYPDEDRVAIGEAIEFERTLDPPLFRMAA